MAKGRKKKASKKDNGSSANIGFEAKLWAAADKMRGHMDAAEYKHVALGLIFLKYISDAFQAHRTDLEDKVSDPDSEWYVQEEEARYLTVEDRDEYMAENVFWVPMEARWGYLQAQAKKPEVGRLIDDAMVAIERENTQLKGVLPKNYARPDLDKQRLGQLIDLIGTISMADDASQSKDVLGRVYEYFLGRFAAAEGKGGGEFYTPSCVVRLMVEMIEPYKGRVYDPCCGSGGMFVQSEQFVEAHGGQRDDISIYGQESNPTTWRLCRMNLAIRGIDSNLGPQHADSFHNDLHQDLKADYVLANPPFNVSDWGGGQLREDKRWKYGAPPVGNANFGWVQHIIHHLSPNGMAGLVLANGSMSSNTSSEGDIRQSIVEADLVDCMIAMPSQLFYTTGIPVCLWFFARNKKKGKGLAGQKLRDRSGELLFIDARKVGTMIDRVHRELADEDILRVAGTYHAWRGEKGGGKYEDVAGFCKSATLDEIAEHGHVLTPGRYVGAEELEDDGEPFEGKMQRLTAKLDMQFKESARLEKAIRANMKEMGHGV